MCRTEIFPALRILAVSLFAVVMAFHSQTALAQNTGSIFGTVQDHSGAIIPGADVTAADAEHGVTRSVVTNGAGDFNIGSLPVGTYALTVTAAQFETKAITGIKVDANSNLKEVVSLLPGGAHDTVTVVDDSGSVIDAKSATLGTLIDNKLIEDMPIDGHNVVALSALLPGVVDVNAPTTTTEMKRFQRIAHPVLAIHRT